MRAKRGRGGPGAEVACSRILLRPMTEDDVAAVAPWYGEAATAVTGLPADEGISVQDPHCQLEAARVDPKGGLLVIARHRGPEPIGLLDYRMESPSHGWLTVGVIALAAGQRGWGYGSEAVRLLEAEMSRRRRGMRFRAGVDVRNGTGFYFWLRLGYRPARPDEHFWPPAPYGDIIWMVRVAA